MALPHSLDMTNTTRSQSAYQAANQVLTAKGRSFHWARRVLGKLHANRATRLYGFCRWVDDLADEAESKDIALEQLDKAAAEIRAGTSSDPLLIDALRLMEECHIDHAIALELIYGVTGDLGAVRIQTQAELLRYCYRVAGTVGLMMSAALDVTDEAALPYAIDLGIGMQLTNICRDVREDALSDRRYLPAEIVGELYPADLVSPTSELKPEVCSGIVALLKLANTYYNSGEDGLAYLPMRARAGILIASRVYGGIGKKIRNQDYDYRSARSVVSAFEKLSISALSLGQALVMREFWSPLIAHDANLHLALAGLPKTNAPSSHWVRASDVSYAK